MPALDLSGAEELSFDAVPAGRYLCTIHEVTAGEIEEQTGKLPEGTPWYNIQFRISEDQDTEEKAALANRRLFNRYYVPDTGTYEKAAIMQGMFVSFLKASGYSEEEIKSGDFDFDPEDLIGNEILVTVGKEQKRDRDGNVVEGEFNNPVKSVRLPIAAEETSSSLL